MDSHNYPNLPRYIEKAKERISQAEQSFVDKKKKQGGRAEVGFFERCCKQDKDFAIYHKIDTKQVGNRRFLHGSNHRRKMIYRYEYGKYSPYLKHKHIKPNENGKYPYTYTFANGQTCTVELTKEKFEKVLELDHVEYNANHKQDRRRAHQDFEELQLVVESEIVEETKDNRKEKIIKEMLSPILTKKQLDAYYLYCTTPPNFLLVLKRKTQKSIDKLKKSAYSIYTI